MSIAEQNWLNLTNEQKKGLTVIQKDLDGRLDRVLTAAQRTQSLAQELKEKYPKSDYAARGESIAFRVAQGIPIYGSDRD